MIIYYKFMAWEFDLMLWLELWVPLEKSKVFRDGGCHKLNPNLKSFLKWWSAKFALHELRSIKKILQHQASQPESIKCNRTVLLSTNDLHASSSILYKIGYGHTSVSGMYVSIPAVLIGYIDDQSASGLKLCRTQHPIDMKDFLSWQFRTVYRYGRTWNLWFMINNSRMVF